MPDGPTNEQSTMSSVPTSTSTSVLQHVKPAASSSNGQGTSLALPIVPHITDRFIPLSHIVAALTRASYDDLQKLRDSLVDAPDQKRKRRVVEYTQKYRAEFAKLLVLSSWSTRAGEISTAIDVRAWLQGQKNCFDNLHGMLKFDVLPSLKAAKVPAADLETAIDILSSGTVPRLRDTELSKQFKESEKPHARKIFGILRSLNALINLRLSLHDTLPHAMRDFTVASGRATFRVAHEFEVDVFFANEEIERLDLQWFVIDFRFANGLDDRIDTPSSLSIEIEAVANDLMAKTLVGNTGKYQLVELYNFLHRFTIQYRLERLFDQFSRMGSRDKGKIDLKYASSQRVLAIGFWLRKKQRDSTSIQNSFTITIGDQDVATEGLPLTSERVVHDYNREELKLTVRSGDDVVSSEAIKLDQYNAFSLYKSVVQQRSCSIVESVYKALLGDDLPFTRPTSSILIDGALQVRLTKDENLHVSVDPFNGDFLLHVSTSDDGSSTNTFGEALKALEVALNSLSSPREQAFRIHDFKFTCIKQSIEALASSANWSSLKFTLTSLNLDEFGRAFGSQSDLVSPTACLFLTRIQEDWKNSFGSSWFVVITVKPTGFEFWITEMTVENKLSKWRIQWVERLSFGNAIASVMTLDAELDLAFFERLWKLTTARIISLQLSRGLADRYIDHRYDRHPSARPTWKSFSLPIIRFAAEDITRPGRLWTSPLITIELHDVCTDATGGATVSFIGETDYEVEYFHLSQSEDPQISAHPSTRVFSINLKAAVAHCSNLTVAQLCLKWRMIENTIALFTAAVKSAMKFPDPLLVMSVSLDTARFFYGDNYILEVEQVPSLFPEAVTVRITLASTTGKVNPHARVSEFLEPLAVKFQSAPRIFFRFLILTFPVLEALSIIEQQNFTSPECYIMARSIEEYRIYYPRKNVTLLLRARPAPRIESLPEKYRKLSGTALWHFTDAFLSSSTQLRGQTKINSCEAIFNQGLNEFLQTDQTFPEGTGIGCSEALAAQVLMEVHRTIMEQQLDVADRPASSATSNGLSKETSKSQEPSSSSSQPGSKGKKSTASRARPGSKGQNGGQKNGVIEIN